MRNWLFIFACLWVTCIASKPEGKFVLTGVCIPGEMVSLQQNQTGRVEVVVSVKADDTGKFRLEYPCQSMELFYISTLTSNKLVPLVVRPGEQIDMDLTGQEIVWQGDGVNRHKFVQEFQQQKQKWNALYQANITDIANYRQMLQSKYEASRHYLENTVSPEEDVRGLLKAQTILDYYGGILNYPFFYQLVAGKVAELPEDYYVVLKDVDISSPYLKYLGNSCSFLQDYFTALEGQGYLKAGKDDYLLKRAELIKDAGLREDYLLYVVSHVELFGYNQYLGNQLERMRHWIVSPNGRSEFDEMNRKYAEGVQENQRLNAGQDAFDFTGVDVNGKVHRLSDYKGKVVVVDVWNLGCKPCIAEIPYLKNLEKQFAGKQVVFISYALDKQVESWKHFLQSHQMEGNQWINTETFKSDFARDYHVRFIPRFMVFGKNGKIMEVYAPRPSNSRLAQLIEEELNK